MRRAVSRLLQDLIQRSWRQVLCLIEEKFVERSTMPENAVDPDGKPTPELMEWARRTFDEEEFRTGVREIERTGGLELKDFLHERDQEGTPGERGS